MVTDCAFPSFGGIESHIHYLSSMLGKMGHRVYVITHYSKEDNGNGIIYCEKEYYTLIKLPGFVLYKFGADISLSIRSYYSINELIVSLQPDIIHGHSMLSLLVYQSMILAKKYSIPFLITKHSMIFRSHPAINRFISMYLNPFRLLKNCVKTYFGVSKKVLDEIPASETVKIVIYNGIDKNEIAPVREINDIFKELNIDPGEIVLGFVSRLIKEKGVYDFIETIRILKTRGMKIKGVMIGDGPLYSELERKLSKEKLERDIILTGKKEHAHIGDYFRIFNYFFLPTYSEGLGIVLLEAMMFRTFVISYDTGGTSEIILNKKTGMISNDPLHAADIIQYAMNDNALYNKIVDNAELFSADFTWELIGEKTENEYKKVIRK